PSPDIRQMNIHHFGFHRGLGCLVCDGISSLQDGSNTKKSISTFINDGNQGAVFHSEIIMQRVAWSAIVLDSILEINIYRGLAYSIFLGQFCFRASVAKTARSGNLEK
ncbi:25008_t:CDS:1, partial [Cetraspora pellucida]